ncbi:MAG: SDR family NAD(P)-dependent oxidoreductase [Verrucomicrobia bacterium]|nr:MAG: SDR family NAD(P)-dependent oxidoreductase [Verrucomicrobiota bacterium]
MKIIVTGGAGFIGSHVVRSLLSEGHEVTIIDDFNDFYDPTIKRSNIASFPAPVEIAEIDLRNWEAVLRVFEKTQPDAVIHLAARAGVRPSIADPKLYIDTNITGTFHVLEAARRSGCQKIIFASSSSVYGHSKTVPFREDLPILQTLSPYAATKIAGEQLCGNYVNLHGMRIACLRFFTVYGPGQRPDLAIHSFTDAIENGRPIKQFGDGSTRRDYTYIDDIVQGVLGALSYVDGEGPLFEIFNLGENETTTLAKLIAAIEKALGKKAVIERLPEQKGDMPLTAADITKARTLLGYSPSTPIREGIPKFVNWYRELNSHDKFNNLGV